MENLGCKACHARTIGGRGRPSDDRRGAGGIWGARHAVVRASLHGALCRMIVGARRGDLGRRRPGVIGWRPLSDDRRGAEGIWGAVVRASLHGALCQMIGGAACHDSSLI
jgi:hypothetical protein